MVMTGRGAMTMTRPSWVNDHGFRNLTDYIYGDYNFSKNFSGASASVIAGNVSDNDSEHRNASPEFLDLNPYYFYETEQFVLLGVLFVFIVLGNCLVLVALLLDRKHTKSRMNFFLLHLSLAGMECLCVNMFYLSVGLISVLTDIIWRWTVTWHAGNMACKVIRYVQAFVTYSSTYVLVALSIDRYDAITHPMNFSSSSRRARALVVLAWTFSAFFSTPIFVLYEEKYVEQQLQCWIELSEQWQWQLYMTLVAAALFFIPAIIITGCYTVIVCTIWTKGRILTPSDQFAGSVEGTAKIDEFVNLRRASSRGIIPRAKVKTVKMTFVIIFVFILCWSPYIVFDLLQVYGFVPKTQTNIAIATFIQSLAPLNSAANPLICCFFSNHIRRNIRRLPPFRWCLVNVPSSSRRSIFRTQSTETVSENLRMRKSLRSVTIKVSQSSCANYSQSIAAVTNF